MKLKGEEGASERPDRIFSPMNREVVLETTPLKELNKD
jgi:hypothetical protein